MDKDFLQKTLLQSKFFLLIKPFGLILFKSFIPKIFALLPNIILTIDAEKPDPTISFLII